MEIDRRNPFSRVLIQGEGDDAKKRDVFSLDELRQGYKEAFNSGNPIRLLMPLLGETGCRLGEIVGLRLSDVDLENRSIRLTPHSARRLKTSGSEREIPLVGLAFEAMRSVVGDRQEGYLYERYLRDGTILCTHASNTLSKWLKRRFDGKTGHCLRHTFRDRLRAVECPLEMIDALGGWSSIGTVGVRYGRGFDIEHKRKWLEKIALDQP
jgi:integrase